MNFKHIKAEEYCVSVRDGTHDTPKPVSSGKKLVTGKHLKNGRILQEDAYCISEADYDAINKRSKVDQWDVLMSMIGSIGELGLVDQDPDYAIKNIALFKCGDEIKARWLFYYLSGPLGQSLLHAGEKGGAQQFLSLRQIRNLPVAVADEKFMKEVVDILVKYDLLIENNRKQIKLLEEAARRLYKEWFVDLRFPGHEHTPIVNGIPEGWRKTNIGEVCETVGGGTPSTKFEEYYSHGTIPWVTPTDITRNDCLFLLRPEKYITEEGLNKSSAKLVPPYTILMTSRASVGFFGLSRETVCTNQGFISCIPHDKAIHYYMLYNLMDRVDEIRAAAGGSTYLEIRKSDFRKFVFIVPSSHVLECFNQIVGSILKKMENLKHGIDHLTEARDRLLPKLMSGEIAIK